LSTVDQTIDSALRMNGLIGPGHTWASGASSGLRIAAIDILNSLLASWGADGINVPSEVALSPFAITVADGSYTIGSGGNINVARPADISKINWLPTGGNMEMPMYRLSDDEYESWPDKTQVGQPVAWNYKNVSALGTLYILRPPSSSGSLVIYVPSLFTVYTLGSNTVGLADGYDEAIRATLALRYLAEFSWNGAKMDPVVLDGVQRTARDAKAIIRRLNYRRPMYSADLQESRGYLSFEDFESGAFLHW